MIRGTVKHTSEVREIKPSLRASIHNKFDLEVVDAHTQEIKQTAVGYNTILNSLWSLFASYPGGTSWATYIHYGSGTATPTTADTSLTGFIAAMSASQSSVSWDHRTGIYKRQITCTLSETTAVGKTISEVGIANGSASNTLRTKALLKDMNGNPISIVKTNTDIIRIYATVFVHVDVEGYDKGKIKIFGRSGTGFLHTLAGANGGMPTRVYAATSGGQLEGKGRIVPRTNAVVTATPSFNATTRTLKLSTVRFGASVGNNPKGLSTIAVGCADSFIDILLYVGGDWYPGTKILGESLGTGDGAKVDFATDFGYISNPKVYVDGVEVADVTFDLGEPVDPRNNYLGHMIQVDSSGNPTLSALTESVIESAKNVYLENPNYPDVGIDYFNSAGLYVYGSDSLSGPWTNIVIGYQSSAVITDPAKQHYKYYRLEGYTSSSITGVRSMLSRTTNIHFASPPAEGAVITIDYDSNTIGKDANHVFDFSMEIQLGEYTEAQ